MPRSFGAATVVVCVASIDAIALATSFGLLSASERDRARRITSEDYRTQVVKSRALLRTMLGRCTGISPRDFAFAEGGGEAPRLVSNPWRLYFSVSHSADWAIVAIGQSPLGIDIERVYPDCDWATVAEICFHPNEQKRLRAAPQQARLEAFFETWTRKEAYLKGIGVGLSEDPSSFDTTSRDGAVATDDMPASGRRWFTHPISTPAGYKGALASIAPWIEIAQLDLAIDVNSSMSTISAVY